MCSIIPPYLLESLCNCEDDEVRESAHSTFALQETLHKHRHDLFAAKCASLGHQHGDHGHHDHGSAPQGIIPGALLEAVSTSDEVDDETKKAAQKSLQLSQEVRDDRATVAVATSDAAVTVSGLAAEAGPEGTETGFWRGVYDMKNKGDANKPWTFSLLPGRAVRLEGQAPSKDKAVNEAYDNALNVLQFYKKHFNYNSLDNNHMPVKSSVHFGQSLGNAFWLSSSEQMVYGDGNTFIHNFTGCIDVIGHEMTHAVTQYNSALEYKDESGALNEHLSDVFGIMVKQMVEDETAENADWLIGEGCLLPGVKGVSLRNMKNPGTAYNDPRFGADLQPASVAEVPAVMAKYGDFIRNRDYGGVHIFSGIPNRAFVLAATAFGGYSWERAGQIWWKVVTERRIGKNCTFVQFADATVDAAAELYDADAAKIVRDAWTQVGVVRTV
ncbi:metalloprotease [Lasiosphaeria ovina]|uniref:Metalloprotease n=1 Tax=Lasiosphaeria ovina TaxID=92902 RepID=A0AAE0KI86_9PEZI|nr:metalloprotease [Lasiosphaeria ovina]